MVNGVSPQRPTLFATSRCVGKVKLSRQAIQPFPAEISAGEPVAPYAPVAFHRWPALAQIGV